MRLDLGRYVLRKYQHVSPNIVLCSSFHKIHMNMCDAKLSNDKHREFQHMYPLVLIFKTYLVKAIGKNLKQLHHKIPKK